MIKKANDILLAQCCTLLMSITNIYFHEHCKQLFCCGWKSSCFLDILDVNSWEMCKTHHQFIHWFEFAHIPTDPPGVEERLWKVRSHKVRLWKVLKCDLQTSGIDWQKTKKGLSTITLAPVTLVLLRWYSSGLYSVNFILDTLLGYLISLGTEVRAPS